MVSKILNLCVNRVFISVDNGKVCRCHWSDAVSEEEAVKLTSDASSEDLAVIEEAEKQLMEFFDGSRKVFNIPLALEGTAFQRKVWDELLKIPYGLTVTYAEMAKKIGNIKAVRAVARACGANPVAVIVPCHRVVASDGTPGGYAGGVGNKISLLELEYVSGY